MLQEALKPSVPVSKKAELAPPPPLTLVNRKSAALNKSTAHFARPSGPDILKRTETFFAWQDNRRQSNVWPYSRSIEGPLDPQAQIRNEKGHQLPGLNFASQDYLSLSTHPSVIEAGVRALRDFGPHAAGSPMLTGNTPLTRRLETAVAQLLGMPHVMTFTSGWTAGFGTITALVRPEDHIVMDNLAHACLQQGAASATQKVVKFEHLNEDAVEMHLKEIRSTDTKNGILVVTEGLYSMDSDTPDIGRLQNLCHEYGATLLVDVAHDLGALGPGGGGQIAMQNMRGKVDLVFGAFSKSFGTNGGFLASHSAAVHQYVKTYSGSYVFSTALPPVQAALAAESIRIATSAEGDELRASLMRASKALRKEFLDHGIRCIGVPSAIVMVPIGDEKVARVASHLMFERQIFANLVEFPAVAINSARFRMQVMARHTAEQACFAASQVLESIAEARTLLNEPDPLYAVVRKTAEAGHGG